MRREGPAGLQSVGSISRATGDDALLSGCDTTTILDHDVARAAVSARCGGALGPDEASGWQRGHSVDLVPGRHGSPHTKLGHSALLSAIALPPAGLQRVSYTVNALAVDDVAGALQADAGDGDGSADVGGGRAEVAQGRAGAPAEANGLCVRTRVTMVAVLTGQIGKSASAFKGATPDRGPGDRSCSGRRVHGGVSTDLDTSGDNQDPVYRSCTCSPSAPGDIIRAQTVAHRLSVGAGREGVREGW